MGVGTGGMAQPFKTLVDFVEDPSSVPSTHVQQLSTSNSKGFDVQFWPLWTPSFNVAYAHK